MPGFSAIPATLGTGVGAEAVALLNRDNAASQEDVRRADLVALLECDLLNEAPMMALAVRQAWRNGAKVYVVDGDAPTPFDSAQERPRNSWLSGVEALPFEFERLLPWPMSLSATPANPVVICGANRKGLNSIQSCSSWRE